MSVYKSFYEGSPPSILWEQGTPSIYCYLTDEYSDPEERELVDTVEGVVIHFSDIPSTKTNVFGDDDGLFSHIAFVKDDRFPKSFVANAQS